jgi:uncharacterized protein (UPF0333 family)
MSGLYVNTNSTATSVNGYTTFMGGNKLYNMQASSGTTYHTVFTQYNVLSDSKNMTSTNEIAYLTVSG